MDLITILKKDYIFALIESYDYEEQEALDSWEDNKDEYLERVFDAISYEFYEVAIRGGKHD
jgi:hypothetical protein